MRRGFQTPPGNAKILKEYTDEAGIIPRLVDMAFRTEVLYVTSEVSPYVKVGGLADVAGSLPAALARLGCGVTVVAPASRAVTERFPLEPTGLKYDIEARGRTYRYDVLTISGSVVPHLFYACDELFGHGDLYANGDDALRFTTFSRAVLASVRDLRPAPAVLHCNDWQTAPIPALLATRLRDIPGFSSIASVFTIHNLLYQGHFAPDTIELTGLAPEEFHFEKTEFFGQFNFMKAGITYADAVTTVSRQYAREILTPEYGCRLDSHLLAHGAKLRGITNGLGQSSFSPARDEALFCRYNIRTFDKGKRKNRDALLYELNLSHTVCGDLPMVAMITRLSGQKGFDLIMEAAEFFEAGRFSLVVLGVGDPKYERFLAALAARHPRLISFRNEFNEGLAKKIYAASDIFLMPSMFEPCGLGQLIAMRYGTVPVARNTGGLGETITDASDGEHGTGFLFGEYSSAAMVRALGRALDAAGQPAVWDVLRRNCMARDSDWQHAASEYVEVYRAALSGTFRGNPDDNQMELQF